MSVMTQEEPVQPAPAAVRRPRSGITIDPARLRWYREDKPWSPQELEDAITRLGLRDDDGRPLTVTRDAITKIENGERKPKARTIRAIIAALGITVRDLTPGGPPLVPHAGAEERRLRLDHQRDLRRFARAHGIRYRNPGSGRVYYSVPLHTAFEAAVAGYDDKTVTELIALARDAGPSGRSEDEPGVTEQDGIEALNLSARTHNALIRHGVRTVGDLIPLSPDKLLSIAGIGPSSLAEITGQLGAAGFTLHGEGGQPDPELLAS